MIMRNKTADRAPFIGTAARILAGVALIGAALIAWRSAAIAAELARVHEQIATLQPHGASRADEFSRWLTPLVSYLDPDMRLHAETADYWSRDYAALAAPEAAQGSDGAGALLMAANAGFRRAQTDAAGRPMAPERLDQVLQGYAGVLRNGGFDRDAAYNYEYVGRLRDAAARSRPNASKADSAAGRGSVIPPQTGQVDGLPSGPTIHGRPGAHPPATRGDEFEVLTPMNFGDREAQPEPTPGVRLPKKG